MITLTRKSNNEVLQLSDRLDWTDELSWSPVQQTVKHGTTGAMHLHINTKKAGRPITLDGRQTKAFFTRSTCLKLEGWAGKAGETFDLLLRGVTWVVVFDQSKGGFDAEPIFTALLDSEYTNNTAAADWYYLPTLRFITTEAV